MKRSKMIYGYSLLSSRQASTPISSKVEVKITHTSSLHLIVRRKSPLVSFILLHNVLEHKMTKLKVVKRVFKKDTSVFKDWKEDTPILLNKAMELDQKEWKAARFIKDPAEVESCWRVIKQNFSKLKDVFITLAARSNFPFVGLLDFTTFAD